MNKDLLLKQLRISRDDDVHVTHTDRPFLHWVAGGVVAALVGAVLIWFLVARPDLTVVQVVEARAASTATSAGGALLDASGYVVARRQATVSSKITDKVLEVLIEEGEHVSTGQIIAKLDDTNTIAALQLAEANLRAQRTAASDEQPIFLRSGRLLKQKAISQEAFDAAKANYDAAVAAVAVAERSLAVARVNEEDTIVRAPFDGVVTVKAAQPGEIVSPISAGGGFTRTGICTIVDMASLEVDVDVAESFINRVHQGMPAVAILNAYPDWNVPAEVIAVIPTADRSKATVSVRVGLKVKDPRVVPEMGVRVEFLDPSATSSGVHSVRSVIVPAEAIQNRNRDDAVVFVVNGDTVERRPVRLGAQSSNGQILLAGVSAGEAVAVSGNDKLSDGERVRIAPPE
jgi:RND family efflux transporter MFP subunit